MTDANTAPTAETHKFEADVNQVLDLVIHSLYSHPDIFLRELVSNASDALDKLRFRSNTEPDLLKDDAAFEIRLIPDEAQGTLTFEDTGVGMTREELVKNLGTIAHSGTRAFLQSLKQQGKSDAQLIGQFGVGFYSAWLVADRVEVVSRAAGEAQAHRWVSEARGTFTVEPAEQSFRGTRIVLHLKPERREFLQPWKLRELVSRYSDFVNHPIKLQETRAAKDGEPQKQEWVTVNRASALWQRPKSEISDEQYAEFYKHLAHDFEAPLTRVHFKAEGTHQYTGLLFVPRREPFDLGADSKRGVKLFVKRVFVMEDCAALLPNWLRFVRGVVDSEDLPLNVSRETLQDSEVVRAIKSQVTRKVLETLEKLAADKPEDYATFWRAFGNVLKEGLALGAEYKDRLGRLLRFESSRQEGELTSLADYVSRMPEAQKAIYFVHGESRKAIEGSPHLESLRQKGWEILYLTDPVDAWAVEGLGEFDGKPLVSAMQADLKVEQSEDEKKSEEEQTTELKPLLDAMQGILTPKVQSVRASHRLTDSPCCLVVPDGAAGAYVERLLRERGRGGALPHARRILEVNPNHALVTALKALHAREPESPQLREWIELLHDQALLTEGSPLQEPHRFAQRVTALLSQVAEVAVRRQA